MRFRTVATLSLAFTYLFFIEYLPPVKRVHIPFDLEGYHYPLDDYAYQAFRHHRFPEWDTTMYCGMSFVGNPQTALFYPPMWLVFLADHHDAWLRYMSLEILQFVHVWLGFLFCFLWLRHRRLKDLACVLGAGVFAYSGYTLLQLQHLGLVGAYIWFPLGLWGIDEACESKSWRPLWKLVLASSMCFLAGYPPMWFVFSLLVGTYSLFCRGHLKTSAWVFLALVFSVFCVMVQAYPAWEMATMKTADMRYGSGSMSRLELWVSYLVPNYFDFALATPVQTNPGGELLYLGVPAFFGVFMLARYRGWKEQIPILALGVASFIMLRNPFGLVLAIVQRSDLLSGITRAWYFLCGLTLTVAALAAAGIDLFLRRNPKPASKWLMPVAIVMLTGLSLRELWIWLPGGPEFASGWRDAVEPLLMLTAFSLAMVALRGESGTRRTWITVALLLAIGIDYKAFGTSKRVDATMGNLDALRRYLQHPGMSNAVYRELNEHPDYRVGLDADAPQPESLRHIGLRTPQGRDPLISAQIRKVLGDLDFTGFAPIDPSQYEYLRLLGIRYFITAESQPTYAKLLKDPEFRMLPSAIDYYKIFELSNPRPSYYWERDEPGNELQRIAWTPENREFRVESRSGGRFILVEQLYPGWQASIDGKSTPIERWHEAFQSVIVPPGGHEVRFTFRSRSVRIGASISVLSILALVVIVRRKPQART